MSKKNVAIRFAVYLLGLLIMTMGIAVSVKSDLGVSPVSSIPYTLTVIWGIELGQATILFHVALVLIQIVILRKAFKLKNLLQVPVGIIFGAFTSLCLYTIAFIPTPTDVWVQLALSLISIVLIAFGIFLYVPADMVPLAGEGVMLAVSQVTNIKFSTAKILFDCTMVVVSLVTCLALIHSLGSVGIGTVIAAALVGICLKGITKVLAPARDKLLQIGIPPATDQPAQTPLSAIMEQDVYTLSPNNTYAEALRFFADKNINGAPVVNNEGALVGFISDGDILRLLGGEHSLFVNDADMNNIGFNEQLNAILDTTIAGSALKNVIAVNANDDLSDVCHVLAEHHLKKAPVLNNGHMIGIINRRNITNYALELMGV